jgi:hypothetical protein
MTDVIHRVRNSLATRERAYSLGPEALQWSEDGGASGQVPYRDISRVQLIRYAGADGPYGQCTLRERRGRKLVFRAQHYVSLGNFEARPDSYRALVTGLCRRVAAANPQAEFIRGNTGLRILWIVVLMVVLLCALLVALVLLELAGYDLRAWSGLISLLVLAALAWKAVRINKVVTFDPEQPPV